VADFVHDNVGNIPFPGKFGFISPAKLRVGILPLV
jgi:hypothetical protein